MIAERLACFKEVREALKLRLSANRQVNQWSDTIPHNSMQPKLHDYGSEGWGFKSLRMCQPSPAAQRRAKVAAP